MQRPHQPRVRPDGVDVPRLLLAARQVAGLRDLGFLGAHLDAVFLGVLAIALCGVDVRLAGESEVGNGRERVRLGGFKEKGGR